MATNDPWIPVPNNLFTQARSPDYLERTSEQYIASLEYKLQRLHGKNGKQDEKSKSKLLLQGLSEIKDVHMYNLTASSEKPYLSDYIPIDDLPSPSLFNRKINPEKIAINKEESVFLVNADNLSEKTLLREQNSEEDNATEASNQKMTEVTTQKHDDVPSI